MEDTSGKSIEELNDFPEGAGSVEPNGECVVPGNLPETSGGDSLLHDLKEETPMDTVSTAPTFTAMADNDWSSKNLDSLIAQGNTLNGLQAINRDVLLARGDAALETQRTANELVREILQTKAEAKEIALQSKFDLSNQIKEEGQKTREFLRDCKAAEAAADIAALKLQIVALGGGSALKAA